MASIPSTIYCSDGNFTSAFDVIQDVIITGNTDISVDGDAQWTIVFEGGSNNPIIIEDVYTGSELSTLGVDSYVAGIIDDSSGTLSIRGITGGQSLNLGINFIAPPASPNEAGNNIYFFVYDNNQDKIYQVSEIRNTSGTSVFSYGYGACIPATLSEGMYESSGNPYSFIVKQGCMDPSADNFSNFATIPCDDCCIYYGCTDEASCNYDASANTDDGSCQYPPDGCNQGQGNCGGQYGNFTAFIDNCGVCIGPLETAPYNVETNQNIDYNNSCGSTGVCCGTLSPGNCIADPPLIYYPDVDDDGVANGCSQEFCSPQENWTTVCDNPTVNIGDCPNSPNNYKCNDDEKPLCGTDIEDSCGFCSDGGDNVDYVYPDGSTESFTYNNSTDCNGDCFNLNSPNPAYNNLCGECVGGNSGTSPTILYTLRSSNGTYPGGSTCQNTPENCCLSSAVPGCFYTIERLQGQDCAGVCGTSAVIDECSVCDGSSMNNLGCGCFNPTTPTTYYEDSDGDGLGCPGTNFDYCLFSSGDDYMLAVNTSANLVGTPIYPFETGLSPYVGADGILGGWVLDLSEDPSTCQCNSNILDSCGQCSEVLDTIDTPNCNYSENALGSLTVADFGCGCGNGLNCYDGWCTGEISSITCVDCPPNDESNSDNCYANNCVWSNFNDTEQLNILNTDCTLANAIENDNDDCTDGDGCFNLDSDCGIGNVCPNNNDFCCTDGSDCVSDTNTYCIGEGYVVKITGCMNDSACNFNSDATTDDGSCIFPTQYWQDQDLDGVAGCDSPTGSYCPGNDDILPTNHYTTCSDTDDDCQYDTRDNCGVCRELTCEAGAAPDWWFSNPCGSGNRPTDTDWNTTCSGCMDPLADNYDPTAIYQITDFCIFDVQIYLDNPIWLKGFYEGNVSFDYDYSDDDIDNVITYNNLDEYLLGVHGAAGLASQDLASKLPNTLLDVCTTTWCSGKHTCEEMGCQTDCDDEEAAAINLLLSEQAAVTTKYTAPDGNEYYIDTWQEQDDGTPFVYDEGYNFGFTAGQNDIISILGRSPVDAYVGRTADNTLGQDGHDDASYNAGYTDGYVAGQNDDFQQADNVSNFETTLIGLAGGTYDLTLIDCWVDSNPNNGTPECSDGEADYAIFGYNSLYVYDEGYDVGFTAGQDDINDNFTTTPVPTDYNGTIYDSISYGAGQTFGANCDNNSCYADGQNCANNTCDENMAQSIFSPVTDTNGITYTWNTNVYEIYPQTTDYYFRNINYIKQTSTGAQTTGFDYSSEQNGILTAETNIFNTTMPNTYTTTNWSAGNKYLVFNWDDNYDTGYATLQSIYDAGYSAGDSTDGSTNDIIYLENELFSIVEYNENQYDSVFINCGDPGEPECSDGVADYAVYYYDSLKEYVDISVEITNYLTTNSTNNTELNTATDNSLFIIFPYENTNYKYVDLDAENVIYLQEQLNALSGGVYDTNASGTSNTGDHHIMPYDSRYITYSDLHSIYTAGYEDGDNAVATDDDVTFLETELANIVSGGVITGIDPVQNYTQNQYENRFVTPGPNESGADYAIYAYDALKEYVDVSVKELQFLTAQQTNNTSLAPAQIDSTNTDFIIFDYENADYKYVNPTTEITTFLGGVTYGNQITGYGGTANGYVLFEYDSDYSAYTTLDEIYNAGDTATGTASDIAYLEGELANIVSGTGYTKNEYTNVGNDSGNPNYQIFTWDTNFDGYETLDAIYSFGVSQGDVDYGTAEDFAFLENELSILAGSTTTYTNVANICFGTNDGFGVACSDLDASTCGTTNSPSGNNPEGTCTLGSPNYSIYTYIDGNSYVDLEYENITYFEDELGSRAITNNTYTLVADICGGGNDGLGTPCSELDEDTCGTTNDDGGGGGDCVPGTPSYAIYSYDVLKDYIVPIDQYNLGVNDTYEDLFITRLSMADTNQISEDNLVRISYDADDSGDVTIGEQYLTFRWMEDYQYSNVTTYLEGELANIVSGTGYTENQYDVGGDGNVDYAVYTYNGNNEYVDVSTEQSNFLTAQQTTNALSAPAQIDDVDTAFIIFPYIDNTYKYVVPSADNNEAIEDWIIDNISTDSGNTEVTTPDTEGRGVVIFEHEAGWTYNNSDNTAYDNEQVAYNTGQSDTYTSVFSTNLSSPETTSVTTINYNAVDYVTFAHVPGYEYNNITTDNAGAITSYLSSNVTDNVNLTPATDNAGYIIFPYIDDTYTYNNADTEVNYANETVAYQAGVDDTLLDVFDGSGTYTYSDITYAIFEQQDEFEYEEVDEQIEYPDIYIRQVSQGNRVAISYPFDPVFYEVDFIDVLNNSYYTDDCSPNPDGEEWCFQINDTILIKYDTDENTSVTISLIYFGFWMVVSPDSLPDNKLPRGAGLMLQFFSQNGKIKWVLPQ